MKRLDTFSKGELVFIQQGSSCQEAGSTSAHVSGEQSPRLPFNQPCCIYTRLWRPCGPVETLTDNPSPRGRDAQRQRATGPIVSILTQRSRWTGSHN